MNPTYELQMARAERKRWKKVAVQMYELIRNGDIRDAEAVFEEYALTYRQEDQ